MRRFELVEGTANKFWEIEVSGTEVTTRWGRIGTKGQSKTKSHASDAAAGSDADKQIRKKTGKGYLEAGVAVSEASTDDDGLPVRTSGDLADGEACSFRSGSGRTYTLKNVGGAWSCSCPAWLHQSEPAERRTCKHLRAFRGDAAEQARLGSLPERVPRKSTKRGAPAVLLAESWIAQDPTGWWMSEKLDGVRAWWDGERFLSRQGNRFVAPDWFVEHLPDHPLDGELFAGRGRFQATVSIVRSIDRSERWRQMAFVVFDAPARPGPFEDRLAHADSLDLGRWASVLDHERCESPEHMHLELRRVEALGGEGLMLRKPGSTYAKGRSETLLKVKTFRDAEATVVAHLPGSGRHRGRLGALRVELADGTRFKVGTGFSDREREAPPAIGAVITFRYQELTNGGVPRFPTFLRIRDP